MNRIGEWVALVCFVSLALLPWWVLAHGWDWGALAAGGTWVVLGTLGAIDPAEWRKTK